MEVEAEATGGVVGDQEFSPELLRFFYGRLDWLMRGKREARTSESIVAN